MSKLTNTKFNRLLKYYTLINHDLIYNNKTINRYKNKVQNKNKSIKLEKLKQNISNINTCHLKKNATNLVFADGNSDAKIMLIGEGPGANEDKEGIPFVGRGGQLLDKMLAAIDLNRSKVYITNVVNFRPPDNRKPTPEEINR